MRKEEISQETRQELVNALKELMAKKPFEKISITELLQRCNISRSTFYYHFEDIYALMRYLFETEMISLLDRSENVLDWQDGVLLLFRYAQENSKVCLCAYRGLGREYLRQSFSKVVQPIISRLIETLSEGLTISRDYIVFVTDFYTMALAGELSAWLNDGMKKTPEEMVYLLDITCSGNMIIALKRAEKEGL